MLRRGRSRTFPRTAKGAVRRAWFQLGLHVSPEQVQHYLAQRGVEVSLGQIVQIHRHLLRGNRRAAGANTHPVRKPRRLRPIKRPQRRR